MTIKNVIPFLDHRQKAEVLRTGGISPVFVSYYHQIVAGKDLGKRGQREFLTLATALDQLIMGNTPEVGDLLVQRLKAIETAASDQNWEVAQNVELLQSEAPSLLSRSEKTLVTKETQQHQSTANRILQATQGKGKAKGLWKGARREWRGRAFNIWERQSEEREHPGVDRDRRESPQPENRDLPARPPVLRSPRRELPPRGKGKGKQKGKQRRTVSWG